MAARIDIDNKAVDVLEFSGEKSESLPAIPAQPNTMTSSRPSLQNDPGTIRVCVDQKNDFFFHVPVLSLGKISRTGKAAGRLLRKTRRFLAKTYSGGGVLAHAS